MSKIFVILILLTSLNSWTQNNDNNSILIPPSRQDFSSGTNFNFEFIEINDDSLKLALLKRTPSTDEFRIICESIMCDEFDMLFPYFHVIDINNDSLPDIVFNGSNPSGRESWNVAIFMNEGDSLRPCFAADGLLYDFNMHDAELIYFDLVYTGCCGQYTNGIARFEYYAQNQPVKYIDYGRLMPYGYQGIQFTNQFSFSRSYLYIRSTYFPKNVREQRTMEPLFIQKTDTASWLVPEPKALAYVERDTNKYDAFAFNENRAICFLPKETKIQVLFKGSVKGQRYAFIVVRISEAMEPNIARDWVGEQLFGWVEL